MHGMRLRRDGPVRKLLTDMRRAVVDRFMRWRGHPPQEAGVREPWRPKPTLPAAAVAIAEPRVGLRRWLKK
jgi:hypothetical protein